MPKFILFKNKERKRLDLGIYLIKNSSNNRAYLGSTSTSFKQRFKEHKIMLRTNKHHNQFLQNDYNKNSKNTEFHFQVIESLKNKSHEEILEREQEWLDLVYDNQKLCYNMCPKVSNVAGRKHSEETKKKMSEAHKGKKVLEETRKKMSKNSKERTHLHFKSGKDNLMFGRTGEKHPFFGKKHSEESRKKMSKNSKGKPNVKNGKIVGQFSLDDGAFLRTYPSASEAFRQTGIDRVGISTCAQGKKRSAGNFAWKYINSIDDILNKVEIKEFNPGFHGEHSKKSIELMRNTVRCKRVGQYNKLTGELIKIFRSTKEAERETDINNAAISSCCLGKRASVYGFIWKYL